MVLDIHTLRSGNRFADSKLVRKHCLELVPAGLHFYVQKTSKLVCISFQKMTENSKYHLSRSRSLSIVTFCMKLHIVNENFDVFLAVIQPLEWADISSNGRHLSTSYCCSFSSEGSEVSLCVSASRDEDDLSDSISARRSKSVQILSFKLR